MLGTDPHPVPVPTPPMSGTRRRSFTPPAHARPVASAGMDDYQDHDAVGLAALVRDGQVSAAELLAAARARAEAVNAEDQRDRGRRRPARGRRDAARSPACRSCSRTSARTWPATRPAAARARWPGRRSPENATVVDRWLDAGLVVFGKTNTPEFGAKGITEPHLFGPARNPWDTDHTPGGSSGGSAAAVAAGIVPCAAASDGGGSIRIPASACGLFGLKASRGLVPVRAAGLRGDRRYGDQRRDLPLGPRHRRDARRAGRAGPGLAVPRRACPRRRTPTRSGRTPARLRIAVCTASAINPDSAPGGGRGRDRGGRAPRLARPRGRARSTRRRSTTPPWPATSSPRGSRTSPTRSRRPRRSAAGVTRASSPTPW